MIQSTFYPVFFNGNILQHYSTVLQDIDIDTGKTQGISITTRISYIARLLPHPVPSCPPFRNSWQPLISIHIILPFQEYVNGTLQYVTFRDLLFFTEHSSLDAHSGCCMYH